VPSDALLMTLCVPLVAGSASTADARCKRRFFFLAGKLLDEVAAAMRDIETIVSDHIHNLLVIYCIHYWDTPLHSPSLLIHSVC
jgi:hypothetical protein